MTCGPSCRPRKRTSRRSSSGIGSGSTISAPSWSTAGTRRCPPRPGMSAISLRRLTKRFGSVVAVGDLSLEVRDGELIALLGPSGCGKTTTLRSIAGFETPDAGEIYFGDRRVTALLPEQRNIGMVFQNYALFPHLTVFENVAFGLEMRRERAGGLGGRGAAVLAKGQLPRLGRRDPRPPSGGPQQGGG